MQLHGGSFPQQDAVHLGLLREGTAVFPLGDLDKRLHLQPGRVAHGSDLHRHRGVIQQRHLGDARDHCIVQTGHDGHGGAHGDHDQSPLKAGGDLAAIHPPPGPAPPGKGALAGRKEAVKDSGGHHALALQVRQVQGLAVCQGAVGVHKHIIGQGEQGRKGRHPGRWNARWRKKTDIQLAGPQFLQRAAVALGDHFHLGIGVLPLVLCQDAGKGAVIKELPQPHHQMGPVCSLDILGLFQGLAAKTGHLHHVQVKGLAGGGELGAPGGAVEQVEPRLLFPGC